MAPRPQAQGAEHLSSIPSPMLAVDSTDGVTVAVHELGASDPDARALLISHATGFHGRVYTPLAEALGERYRCLAMDHRGHGATAAPPGWDAGHGVDWKRFGDDALAVATAIAPRGALHAFGHSMGGAALLMAAHRSPQRFERLVVFEPIAHPYPGTTIDMESVPIVQGARRRRRRFDSTDDAFENFRSKPPLSTMTTEALRQYVDHGLRPVAEGGVELCCAPELEAAIFVKARHNGVWDLLPEVEVPVVVVAGAVEPNQPSFWCRQIAERLPRGHYVSLPHLTHFGPLSDPAEVAALIASEG